MKNAITSFSIIIVCLLGFIFYQLYFNAVPAMPVNLLIAPNLPQDAFAFTPKDLPLQQSLLTPVEQAHFHKLFLQRFYYPWSAQIDPKQFCITANGDHCKPVISIENAVVTSLAHNLGYNSNYQANSKQWYDAIIANMQLDTFPNMQCNGSDRCHGITVENTNIRTIPTNDPSYAKITEPGEAYPFDLLQESNLWVGTPVLIVQRSKDQRWLLVQAPGLLGWVSAKSIAFTSNEFIQKWQRYKLVTPILRKFTINPNFNYKNPQTIYLGSLLPYLSNTATHFLTLLPAANAKQQAIIVPFPLSNTLVTSWPLKPTPQNFNLLINQLLGMTYGWGGVGFDTDCSGTTQRLLGAFGIWIPRNAKSQLDFAGHIYPLPLSLYSVAKRRALLVGQATAATTKTDSKLPPLKPYLTLIGFGNEKNGIGHVALYLGKYPQEDPKDIVIFQSVWGIPIMQGKRAIGRAIIGKAAITTMNVGEHIDLLHTGYETDSLWQIPGIYVTDLLQPENTAWLMQQGR